MFSPHPTTKCRTCSNKCDYPIYGECPYYEPVDIIPIRVYWDNGAISSIDFTVKMKKEEPEEGVWEK